MGQRAGVLQHVREKPPPYFDGPPPYSGDASQKAGAAVQDAAPTGKYDPHTYAHRDMHDHAHQAASDDESSEDLTMLLGRRDQLQQEIEELSSPERNLIQRRGTFSPTRSTRSTSTGSVSSEAISQTQSAGAIPKNYNGGASTPTRSSRAPSLSSAYVNFLNWCFVSNLLILSALPCTTCCDTMDIVYGHTENSEHTMFG